MNEASQLTSDENCCSDITVPSDPTAVIDVLKAVADPTRLKLLFLVAERGCDDVCGCDLAEAMGVSAPTITHHMKKLAGVGLVTRMQKGKWAHFAINKDLFCHIKYLVDSVNEARALSPVQAVAV